MDALEPMQTFDIYDGAGRPTTVQSLHHLRQLERQSEQLARNGEGQQIAWRAYSNDASQTHDHLFTKDTSRAMDHDLHAAPTEVKLGGRAVQIEGGPVPFRMDGKTTRGTPLVKRTGAPVTQTHGTAD
jgi:hypothetical protein